MKNVTAYCLASGEIVFHAGPVTGDVAKGIKLLHGRDDLVREIVTAEAQAGEGECAGRLFAPDNYPGAGGEFDGFARGIALRARVEVAYLRRLREERADATARRLKRLKRRPRLGEAKEHVITIRLRFDRPVSPAAAGRAARAEWAGTGGFNASEAQQERDGWTLARVGAIAALPLSED